VYRQVRPGGSRQVDHFLPFAVVALSAVALQAGGQLQPIKAVWTPKELPLPPTFVIYKYSLLWLFIQCPEGRVRNAVQVRVWKNPNPSQGQNVFQTTDAAQK
jgi:hypothetical protein